MTPLLGPFVDILAGLIASVIGAAAIQGKLREVLLAILAKDKKVTTETPSEKLAKLTTQLSESSRDFNTLLAEMSELAKNRETAVLELESKMGVLGAREKELKDRIEKLQNTPIEVAEYFAKLTQAGEKRSARRDYMLFAAGVIVSVISALVLKAFGLG